MTPFDLPTFEATWWPVQMETVPGSGELITIAVVVRSLDGQATVRQAIEPPTIASMFGDAGKGTVLIVGTTVLELHKQLNNLVPVELLEMPFGGIQLGKPRDCVARDVNEVFGIAMRLGSGFSASLFGTAVDELKPDQEARRAFEEWADRIKMELLVREEIESLRGAFNVAIPLTARKKARFGFVHGGYVAHFGVLRPGRSVSADLRALKLKLFDLEVVRRELGLQVQRCELIVGYQNPGDAYPSRQRETHAGSWEHLMHEARARNVTALHYTSAHHAAEHLLKVANG